MKTVAERRFDDAEALGETRRNARANGVAYLAGFVIEILLKAKLVEKFPAIARKRQHEVNAPDREIWSLIWKRHDLEGMLSQMMELEASLEKKGQRAGYDYVEMLKKVCATWTIYSRYSTRTTNMAEAADLLRDVRRLKEVLK